MTVFVDTNVLIDFVCNRNEFYDYAESTFALGLSGRIDICFTDISVINTMYVGRKYNYTQDELSNQLLSILSFCRIAPIDDSVICEALSSTWCDKEDATQYFAAKNASADIIITRNPKDFASSAIRVTTPSEFIDELM